MAGDILGVSVSGALASQRALATTGHNIANATTEGYSRQRVELDTRPPTPTGNGAVGNGALVSNVERVYDEFITSEVRENTTVSQALDSNYEYTSQVDNMLADPNAGLAPALKSFFSAVNGVADDPSSVAARQVMLSQADSLSDRFKYLDDRFDALRSGVNSDINNIVSDINEISSSIAKMNDTIIKAREVGGSSPSDLLDQRDRLVLKLSELVAVRVAEQDDGRINVFIGNGQSLVIGSVASEMEVLNSRFDTNEIEVAFKSQHGGHAIITKFLTGGRLGGLFDFKNEILSSSQNNLGRIAIGVSKTFNEQHKLGMTLDNKLGGEFFTQPEQLTPKVLPFISNRSDALVSAEITDINKLTTSDYRLLFRDGTYRLIRQEDNKLIDTFASLPAEIESEGFKLSIQSGSPPQNGDSFIIRPTRAGAENFDTVVKHVKDIAAASPLRTEALVSNMGDAQISAAIAVTTDNPTFAKRDGLNPPFAIRFVDETHFEILDNSGNAIPIKKAAIPAQPAISANEQGTAEPATPATPAQPASVTTLLEYDPANGTDVFPTPDGQDFGFRVKITGNAKAGDTFRIEFNTDGTGDNANIVNLAALQNDAVLEDGTASYTEAYSQLVSRVGSKTHELEINGKAQQLLLDQSVERKESISGVNLDEEAANMVRYQNLYQANAKVIAVANKLLEELMNSFR